MGGESTNSAQAVVPAQVFAPSGLSATAVSGTQVALVWNAFTNAASYNVKRSPVSGGPYTTLVNVSVTNYTDPVASVSAGYYYVVSALVGGSETPNSAEAAVRFPKLAGAIIGTAGSYNSLGDTIANVFDNNLNTFFDGPIVQRKRLLGRAGFWRWA